MPPHRCSIRVAEKLKDFSAEELDEVTRELQRRQRTRQNLLSGEAADEALRNAAGDFIEEGMVEAILTKRNAFFNLQRRVEMGNYLRTNFANDPAEGIKAILSGINRNIKGSRRSIHAEQMALFNEYTGRLQAEVQKAGLWDEFIKGVHDDDVARAMEAIDLGEDLSAINKDAVTLAKIVNKWQEISRVDANRAGAFIGKLPGRIARTSHDMYKIRNALRTRGKGFIRNEEENFQQWLTDILPFLDSEGMSKTIGDAEPTDFYRSAWQALSSGVHLTHAATGDAPRITTGIENIAARMSKERIFHFKDADSWMSYQKLYGRGRLSENILRNLEVNAKQTGLMRVMGPNARNNLQYLRELGRNMTRDSADARVKFDKAWNNIDALFANVDGSVRIAANDIGASVFAAIRAIQSMAKLGGATLSAIADIPLFASELRFQGVGYLEGFGIALKGLTEGRAKGEKLELMAMLGVGLDTWRGDVVARLNAEDGVPGMFSDALATYFKWNGLSLWTDSLRTAAASSMSRRLAMNIGTGWKSLDPDLRRVLGFFDIGEGEWRAFQSAELHIVEGDSFLTPQAARNVDVDHLIQGPLDDLQDRAAAQIKKFETANLKDAETIGRQADRLIETKKKIGVTLETSRKRIGKKRDAESVRVRQLIDETEARIEQAEALSDIESFLKTERARDNQRKYLQRVEEGGDVEGEVGVDIETTKRVGPSIEELSNRNLDRFSVTRGAEGERLGFKKGRATRRLRDLEKRRGAAEKQAAIKLSEVNKKAVARMEKTIKEVAGFVDRAEARILERAQRLTDLDKVVDRRVNRLRQDKRMELERNLKSYFQDRVDFAVVNPDARVQAFMNRGTQRGSVEGEFMRSIMQFKGFPISVLMRPVGRELFARHESNIGLARALTSGKGGAQGLATMVALNTVMGYVAMSAKDISKGRQPRNPLSTKTWTAALVQGGGLGIYGDFLFGQMRSRFGQGPLITFLGPTAGSLNDTFDLFQRFRDGDDFAAKGFNTVVNHAPGANLFYLRFAMDYLILHRIREGMNPGYLARMERRVEEENDQRFFTFSQPSATIPRGGGEFGEFFGGLIEGVDSLNPAKLLTEEE